jgi:CheY-like chemotaxis protein
VILDLMMPGIDGTEVLRRMRARQETRGIPVAMFSAADDPEVRNRLLAAGAHDFWTKGSFDFQKLGERVESLLAQDPG